MMKILRERILLASAVVLAATILVCIWPPAAFRIALYLMSARPILHMFGPSRCSFNTYADNVTPETLRAFYKSGCAQLNHLSGVRERQTYRAQDVEGYPCIVSVVQYSDGYLALEAYEGNDSKGISLVLAPGVFPPANDSRHDRHLRNVPKDEDPGFLKDTP